MRTPRNEFIALVSTFSHQGGREKQDAAGATAGAISDARLREVRDSTVILVTCSGA